MKTRTMIAAACAATMGAASAAAQAPAPNEGWRVEAGGGFLVGPSFDGADTYQVSALPSIRVAFGERFTATVQDGAAYALVDQGGLRAGPIARVAFGRDEDGEGPFQIAGDDTDALIGLGDVDTGVELGAFVERATGPIALRAEWVQGLGGHEGMVADISAAYRTRARLLGPPTFLSVGPRVRLADDDYVESFFGVTPTQSVRSGLSTFEAGGGVVSAGVGAGAVTPLTDRLALVATLSYERLLGDAADAPLVTERGSEDQASAGLFLSYTLVGGR